MKSQLSSARMSPPKIAYKYRSHGKVRDTFELPGDKLGIRVSNRTSTEDVIWEGGVPFKGAALHYISNKWIRIARPLGVPTHFIKALNTKEDFKEYPELQKDYARLRGRTTIVKKLKMLPLEVIVRGNITGSGWKSYEKTGEVCGIKLPEGLKKNQFLETPIVTPTTKAEFGLHDEHVTCEQAVEILKQTAKNPEFDYYFDAEKVWHTVEDYALRLFTRAREIADKKGIILVDTKFEFGLDLKTGAVTLGDEILTMDSSRYWDKENYKKAMAEGKDPTSMDKEGLRVYGYGLSARGKWDKSQENAPKIPREMAWNMGGIYLTTCRRLFGTNDPIIEEMWAEYEAHKRRQQRLRRKRYLREKQRKGQIVVDRHIRLVR
ncbi:MAG: phosphoribosylaminoimidazolesuccinocarboxamide synthase [Rickettsiales bacterium]|jgi:phosphoribosylaminoimidazole-succinocarboxamide synthase|nr:phosphoribosylaminoimidazolesuccinocarboxamide synthase [Rickettsiales bacterium]